MEKVNHYVWFTLVLASYVPSSADGDTSRALDHARRAVLAQEVVKRKLKDAEETVRNNLESIGIDEEVLKYAAWTIPVVSGKVSTRPFKNVGWRGEGWILRPELEMSLSNTENYNGQINFEVTF